MKAVKAELKAGQQIIVNRLLQAKCAKAFVKASNSSIVSQQNAGASASARGAYPVAKSVSASTKVQQQPPLPLLLQSEEEEDEKKKLLVKKKLNFEENSQDINKDINNDMDSNNCNNSAIDRNDSSVVSPRKICMSKIMQAKKKFKMTDCSVVLERISLPSRLFKSLFGSSKKQKEEEELFSDMDDVDFQLLHPVLKRCSVTLENVRLDKKWGPILREMEREEEVDMETEEDMTEEDMAEVDMETDTKESVVEDEEAFDVQEARKEEDEVLDLTGLKERVESSTYTGVLAFHLALKKVCSTVHVSGPAKYLQRKHLMNAYASVAKEVFPWFDPDNPTALHEPNNEDVLPPPNLDHLYSDVSLLRFKKKPEDTTTTVLPVRHWRLRDSEKSPVDDDRKCLFCSVAGDGKSGDVGRLIYYRQNEWVHVNCALWSSEVYEEIDGSLQNVSQALNRGAKLACSACDAKGATIGCCQDNCKSNFHFHCGRMSDAAYKEDKRVFCAAHARPHKDEADAVDFSVARTVHIDMENGGGKRRLSKAVDLRNVRVTVGSLTVHTLGQLVARSDDPDAFHAVPVGFSCTRIFWSVVDPTRTTRYHCRTRLVQPSRSAAAAAAPEEEDLHLVVDHTDAAEKTEALLRDFRKKVREVEVKTAVRNNNVLPPYAVSQQWSHLSYRDLHPEWYQKEEEEEEDRSVLASAAVAEVMEEIGPAHENPSTAGLFIVPPSPVSSPCKRLNKAVGNVMRRTPNKSADAIAAATAVSDDLDLALEEGDFHLEMGDKDIITAILRDGNFEAELTRAETEKKEEEVCLVRTWFNQNKLKKFSEISVQCSLKFKQHVFEMDEEYDRRQQQQQEDNNLLGDEYANSDLNELDIIKILGNKIFEIGTEEQVFELENGDSAEDNGELTFSFLNQDKSHFDDNPMMEGDDDDEDGTFLKGNYETYSAVAATSAAEDMMQQLDGANDDLDELQQQQQQQQHPDRSMPILSEDPISQNSDDHNATITIKRKADNDNEDPTPGGSKDDSFGVETAAELTSPRKDFSIAGLLSPPATGTEGTNDSDDDVVFIPTPPNSSSASSNNKHRRTPKHHQQQQQQPPPSVSPRKLLPKTTMPMQQQQQQQMAPSVYVQHLPSPELATSFPDTFQQTTGRNLQYITSYNSLQLPPGFPQFIPQSSIPFLPQQQQTLQFTPQGFIAAPPQQQQQQYSFLTPQGFIVSSQPAPNYIFAPQVSAAAAAPRAVFLGATGGPTYLPATYNPFLPQLASPMLSPMPVPAAAAPMTLPAAASFIQQQQQPVTTPPKKIARVKPQPAATVTSKSVAARSGRVDPIKALSDMASHPMASSSSGGSPAQSRLTITHSCNTITHSSSSNSRMSSGHMGMPASNSSNSSSLKSDERQRSVGTQARIGAPLKILTPRPWKGTGDVMPTESRSSSSISQQESVSSNNSSNNSVQDNNLLSASSSRSVTPAAADHSYFAAAANTPTPSAATAATVKVTTKPAKANSIKIVLQRNAGSDPYRIQHVSLKDGSHCPGAIEPEVAIRALKVKAKATRFRAKPAALVAKLDGAGKVPHNDNDFVNELEANQAEEEEEVKFWRPMDVVVKNEPHMVFELSAEDGGFTAESADPNELWRKVCEAVQEAREQKGMTASSPLLLQQHHLGMQMLGLTHSALSYLLEQMPGGISRSSHSNATGGSSSHQELKETNASGCARAEKYKSRSPLDMFSWLASRHRSMSQRLTETSDSDASSSNRRASVDLPMAMRFRHLAKNAKEAVGVFSSGIHGRGLYCKREIQSGEMVIEYAGEEIRAILTDKREKHYESRGIGCYMFRIDDDTVVDATMKGNAARFINHSCDPNCHSKIVDILGKKHIIIFALRKIYPGEELTYDYKFPIEDVKLPCNCLAKKCRKYMN